MHDELDVLITGIPDERVQKAMKLMAQRIQVMEYNVNQFLEIEKLAERPMEKPESISFFS